MCTGAARYDDLRLALKFDTRYETLYPKLSDFTVYGPRRCLAPMSKPPIKSHSLKYQVTNTIPYVTYVVPELCYSYYQEAQNHIQMIKAPALPGSCQPAADSTDCAVAHAALGCASRANPNRTPFGGLGFRDFNLCCGPCASLATRSRGIKAI